MRVLTKNGCVYTGRNLDHIMFPMGGIGAGIKKCLSDIINKYKVCGTTLASKIR